MKKWGKKEIMEHLDSLITEAFECDHISVTFPNDNMVRIDLTNDSESLVRCKDCKYCREAHYEEDGEPPIIKLKCENKYGLCRYQAEPDGFCSHGERKDGDGE